jgi:urease alpha subunit
VLIKKFPGTRVIADYYETTEKTSKSVSPNCNIKFYTSMSKPKGRKRKKNEDRKVNILKGIRELTKEQKEWNKWVSHVRAQVECLFGLIN